MESFVQNRLRALRRGYDQSYGNGIWPDKALGAPLSGNSDEEPSAPKDPTDDRAWQRYHDALKAWNLKSHPEYGPSGFPTPTPAPSPSPTPAAPPRPGPNASPEEIQKYNQWAYQNKQPLIGLGQIGESGSHNIPDINQYLAQPHPTPSPAPAPRMIPVPPERSVDPRSLIDPNEILRRAFENPNPIQSTSATPIAQNPAIGQPLSGGDPQTPVSPEPALNPIQALFQRIANTGITSTPPTLPAQQTFVKGQDSSQGGQGGQQQQQNQGFKWQPPSAGMYGGPGPTDTAIDVGNMGLDIGNTALGAVDPGIGQPMGNPSDPDQQTQIPQPPGPASNPLQALFRNIMFGATPQPTDMTANPEVGQFDIGSAMSSAGIGGGSGGMGGLSSLGSGISGLINSFYKNIPNYTFTPPNVAQVTPPTFQYPQLSPNTGGTLPYTV